MLPTPQLASPSVHRMMRLPGEAPRIMPMATERAGPSAVVPFSSSP